LIVELEKKQGVLSSWLRLCFNSFRASEVTLQYHYSFKGTTIDFPEDSLFKNTSIERMKEEIKFQKTTT